MVVLLTDGIDFERNFYKVNESKLIELEEQFGGRIIHLAPVLKVLGNKGMRNNPGKKTNWKKNILEGLLMNYIKLIFQFYSAGMQS